MPSRPRPPRPAMYNTPQIRTGGFGALQVEAITNRPLSIARRHLAASQLRMRDIEPDELSSSEWVRFLVMEERERDRWIGEFTRRRRDSDESTGSSSSTGSADTEGELGAASTSKAEEAAQEAEDATTQETEPMSSSAQHLRPGAVSWADFSVPVGSTPAVSYWARQFDREEGRDARRINAVNAATYSSRRPMHARRAVTDGIMEAPPSYDAVVRARTPPPAYHDEGTSPRSPRYTG